MTNEELDKMLNEMYNIFSNLPSPEREPRRFRYYVKLYKHIKGLL
jgi:hypothetical protein